jgi:hypothetical protein
MLAREQLLAQVQTLAATTSTDGLEEIVQHLQNLNQAIKYVTEEEELRIELSMQQIKEGKFSTWEDVKLRLDQRRAQKA